jgi:hypothetical protein
MVPGQAVVHLKKKGGHLFQRVLAPQQQHVVFGM